ncbi:hypothetical protein B0J13DRAFT_611586 [Dactylonectria estremocensis]|uniref:Uncharacterized protein n=1 Tax=Dactylonectria estremocensis TaxID=1079267 RepID=A0A9P9IPC6_9HYPO|nr:hypothetical protein B0J13DRAFT_611586 [Dactylonectria estremocensis]
MAQKSTQSPEGCGEMQFIEIKNPVDVSWRSAVRSHTARGHYRKARQREILQHRQLAQQRRHIAQAGSMPPATLLPIRSADPFNTLVLPTTRFEGYLLDHYVRYVAVNANICHHVTEKDYIRTGYRTHWVQLAITHRGLLSSIFLSSCRSLAALQNGGPYVERALEYQGACIGAMNNDVSKDGQPITPATIATALALATDSYIMNDIIAAEQHCNAVEVMVRMEGGFQALQMDKFVRTLVKWFSVNPEAAHRHPVKSVFTVQGP